MSIDLREVRDEVIGHLGAGVEAIRELPPHDYLIAATIGLLGIILILGANEAWRYWEIERNVAKMAALEEEIEQLRLQRKEEAVVMILQARRDKINRLLEDGLVDLLLEAELSGKVSRKEVDEELQRISEALALPDLIPRQRRFKIVKDEIKARFNKGVYGKKPHIITGKKRPITERVGTFANQFWRSRRA